MTEIETRPTYKTRDVIEHVICNVHGLSNTTYVLFGNLLDIRDAYIANNDRVRNIINNGPIV